MCNTAKVVLILTCFTEDFHCFCTFFLTTAVVLRCAILLRALAVELQPNPWMSLACIFKVETIGIALFSNWSEKAQPKSVMDCVRL